MKITNMRKNIGLLLIIAVLCCGCGNSNEPVNTEGTVPVETTVVIETTVPVETTTEVETTVAVVSADAFISEVKAAIDGAIGEGEAISDVVLNNNDLCVVVDFTNADPAPLTLGDLAWSRASSITDAILTFAEYDELWETITIDFGETGKVVCNKSDVVSTEYGRYIPSTIFDSLIGMG